MDRPVEAAGGSHIMTAAHRDNNTVPSQRNGSQDQSQRSTGIGATERHTPQQQHQRPFEIDLGAFTRLEQQVAYNYGLLQAHHQDIARLDGTISRFQQDMGGIVAMIEEMRAELRARPAVAPPAQHGRYDPGDVEILVSQIANVTTRANEVDNLKLQVDLLKRRLQRFEDQASVHRPSTSSSNREHHGHGHEPTSTQQPAPPPMQHQHQHQHQHQYQALPPMRPGMSSPDRSRHPGYASQQTVELQQAPPGFHGPSDSRRPSHEQHVHPPGFRPAEPLPPPPALNGWRPAEGYPPANSLPPGVPHGPPARSNVAEPEPVVSGWATVNSAPKRSLDDSASQQDTSLPGSPKRQRLAPLKPRSSYGDEPYPPVQPGYPQAQGLEANFHIPPRIPSNDSQVPPPPPPHAPPIHISQGPPNYRFVTSTHPDGQEVWRPESERIIVSQQQPASGRGRGKGRGGRGRGRGRGGAAAAAVHPIETGQELGPGVPEWEKPQEWTGGQMSPNGYYNPAHPETSRGSVSGHVALPDGESHFPETPTAGPGNPFSEADGPGSANKKTRTKPIRNSEGVLIRKDGRPDMRSVSSANNLRKVHAKKEAERAEVEGRTPTSLRSLAPANSSSLSDDEGEHGEHGENSRSGTPATQGDGETDVQDRHHELMHRIFPHDAENLDGKSTAQAWFPRHDEEAHRSNPIKTESQADRRDGMQDAGIDGTHTQLDNGESSLQQSRETSGGRKERDMDGHTTPAMNEEGDRKMTAEEHAEAAARERLNDGGAVAQQASVQEAI